MGVGALLLASYVIYAFWGASPAPDDLKAWAVVMLIYIGIGFVASIIVQVFYHLGLTISIAVKEKSCDSSEVGRIIKSSMLEDERKKLIELKSSHIGYVFVGFGFVAALVTLAAGVPAIIVLHIMAGSFVFGSILEGCVSVYLNERGVRNG